eukprot:CAMPEP_0117574960 /NCGR_PEP_ID=MMETSP0784-20121206/61932_1 /TAXON_ID=39447 /ORGANISM="" /LENGTH=36 /DNA_ID= /DNA_START= /DNA_END= /DNA_ORIENTATION=
MKEGHPPIFIAPVVGVPIGIAGHPLYNGREWKEDMC